jgi:biotin transport system substrate-specific component
MSDRFSTRDLVLAALFAALTSIGALLALPFFGPIPFTLQVLFVLLAGLVLGPRLAAMSMLAYVALGLVAPVYAGGASGLGTLVGPAGGYIWGFVLGAALVGYLAERLARPRLLSLTAVAAAGLVPIYGLGAAWLAFSLHAFSFQVVLWGGVLQFLPMDLFKAGLAALTVRALATSQTRLPIAAIRSDRLARRSAA